MASLLCFDSPQFPEDAAFAVQRHGVIVLEQVNVLPGDTGQVGQVLLGKQTADAKSSGLGAEG